jgi:preprotein translocase SecE subunit
LEQRFNIAFLISWVVILGGLLAVQRMLLANPRNAEFLITTDEEIKKVTWPSWKDAKDSAVVVLIFVGLLAVFLVLSDRATEFLINLVMKIA